MFHLGEEERFIPWVTLGEENELANLCSISLSFSLYIILLSWRGGPPYLCGKQIRAQAGYLEVNSKPCLSLESVPVELAQLPLRLVVPEDQYLLGEGFKRLTKALKTQYLT